MKILKSFMAGSALPSIILPIALLGLWQINKWSVSNFSIVIFLAAIPVIWGIWSVFCTSVSSTQENNRKQIFTIMGGVLGLLLALFAVFILNLPKLIFGISGWGQYTLLFVAPLIYCLVWRFIISSLNERI